MNAIGALSFFLTMIAAYCLAQNIGPHVEHRHRHEICPGAVYFMRHDSPKPAWAQGERPLCRIGAHDFYR